MRLALYERSYTDRLVLDSVRIVSTQPFLMSLSKRSLSHEKTLLNSANLALVK